MAVEREVKVPNIGDFQDVVVIELLVSPGARVEREGSLVTLESDKATMEVPSPHAGVVRQVLVRVDDRVSEGTPLVVLELSETADPPAPAPAEKPVPPARPPKAAGPAAGVPSQSTEKPAPAAATAAARSDYDCDVLRGTRAGGSPTYRDACAPSRRCRRCPGRSGPAARRARTPRCTCCRPSSGRAGRLAGSS